MAQTLPSGDEVLSLEEAADLVGVSRPYMAASIASGEIELFGHVGDQRFVLASSVRAWHERTRARQRRAMQEMTRSTDETYGGEG
jgi:hypothetical protein